MSEPYEFDAALTVCIDFRSPHAYLAIAPTLAMIEELKVDAVWLPFEVAAMRVPEPLADDDDRGARHRKMRARYFERDLARYAAAGGLELKALYQHPDATLAGAGLLWAGEQGDDLCRRYLTAVFEGFWSGALDLTSADELRAIVDAAGGDSAAFAGYCEGEGVQRYRDLLGRLAAVGIANVPAYWLEESLFYGRQHLPMVRWILTGQKGPGPI